jgi:hypothetical protein
MITFRVGADDATALARYFEPIFEPGDLTNLSLQNIYVTMSIDGETSIPFSAKTLRVPDPEADNAQKIIELSRQRFNSNREEVEQVIAEWNNMSEKPTEQGGRHSTDNLPVVDGEPKPAHVQTRPTPAVAGAQPKNYSEMMRQNTQHKSNTNRKPSDKPANRKRKRR